MLILTEIKKFIKLNKKIIFKKNTKKIALTIDRGLHDHIIRNSIISTAINKIFNLNIVVITDHNKKSWQTYVYKSFGIEKFYRPISSKNIFINPLIFLFCILKTISSIYEIKRKKLIWFVKDYKVKDIHIGEIIYDEYIRHGKKYLNPKVLDLRFIKILFSSILRVYLINDFFNKNLVKFVIVSSKNSINNSSVALRIALKRRITVIFNAHNFIKILNNYNEALVNPRVITNRDIADLENSNIKMPKINKNYFMRLKGYTKGDFAGTQDIKSAYFKKKIMNRNQVLKIYNGNYKKIVLFASHLFADAGHLAGKHFLFIDYYNQMIETIDYIKKLNQRNILWVFKPHPSSHRYGEDGILEKTITELKIPNMVVFPKEISLKSFLDSCDLLITGRGNIAIEAAGLGTNVMVAGNNYYQNLGLVYEPKTKLEYFKLIKNLKMKKLTKKKIMKARKVMYIIDNIHPKIIKRGKIIPEKNPSDYYITTKEYFTRLNKNLKKIDFVKDSYYSHLENVLRKKLIY